MIRQPEVHLPCHTLNFLGTAQPSSTEFIHITASVFIAALGKPEGLCSFYNYAANATCMMAWLGINSLWAPWKIHPGVVPSQLQLKALSIGLKRYNSVRSTALSITS